MIAASSRTAADRRARVAVRWTTVVAVERRVSSRRDITYLPAGVRGSFWYRYAILDVWSRKVVAWAVHAVQSDDLAALLVDEASRREGVVRESLVLHPTTALR